MLILLNGARPMKELTEIEMKNPAISGGYTHSSVVVFVVLLMLIQYIRQIREKTELETCKLALQNIQENISALRNIT